MVVGLLIKQNNNLNVSISNTNLVFGGEKNMFRTKSH